MPTSPKITWLHNPLKVAGAALERYGIAATQLTPMSTSHNAVYRVATADGDFSLRLHRPDTGQNDPAWFANYVRSELVWLQALTRDTALAVPQPLTTTAGELVTMVGTDEDEPVVCSALRWMTGRFYNRSLRPVHLARVGELTAHLHDYSQSGRFAPPADFSRGRADGLDGPEELFAFKPMEAEVGAVKEYLGRLAHDYNAEAGGIVNRAVEQVWADLAAWGYGNDRFGLIHGDIHQWNYLFEHGRAKLLDFNNVGYAHYLYDFAVILENLLGRDDYAALRDGLLQGYQKVRALPSDYHRYLRSLIALRSLQNLHWPLTLPLGSRERELHWPGVEKGLRQLRPYISGDDEWV
jgi:Ser/Thr protein kinase RdoA (MazF antagonist)